MVIWRIIDGKAGHDNQSRGLANALIKITPGVCLDLPALSAGRAVLHYLTGTFPPGSDIEKPEFIIGAGHATHLSILCAQRAYGGKSVVLMKPGLPTSLFDYCLIPDHDKPGKRANIIVTRGALNTISSSHNHDETRGLIMVGGPSKHYRWDNESLLDQISDIISHTLNCNWTITDSPRTPASTSAALKNLAAANVLYCPYENNLRGWLPEQLGIAGQAWVTADSVSMIYESLSSGAATGILAVPGRKNDKITGIINSLDSAGLITTYNDWTRGKPLSLNRQCLNETDRCARELLAERSP
jgi:uncharacterized protein